MTTTNDAGTVVSVATARTPGFDVARAFAVLGMVLVNYKAKMWAEAGPAWLVWISECIEGRSAALFVVLAGVGISLRSKRAREGTGGTLAFERNALLKRAGVLFAAGLLNLHLWEWDILHFYGVYLAIAAFLLRMRGWALGVGAGAFLIGGVVLQAGLDYNASFDFWTARGAMADLFFNGLHPVFPWMAFLLLGMWLGRVDLNEARLRRRVFGVAVLAACCGEAASSIADRAPHLVDLGDAWLAGMSSWPRPPTPAYVVAAAGTAVSVVCLCIEATRALRSPVGVALTATGQLAFTLYIAHAIAIVVPLQHDLLAGGSLWLCYGYSLAFFAVAVVGSLWWRRRFEQGPLEGLIRQITGRTSPAPWGGERIAAGEGPLR